jgi:hypothetical protein
MAATSNTPKDSAKNNTSKSEYNPNNSYVVTRPDGSQVMRRNTGGGGYSETPVSAPSNSSSSRSAPNNIPENEQPNTNAAATAPQTEIVRGSQRGLYVELNEDGTVNEDILVRDEKGGFKKVQSTVVETVKDENGKVIGTQETIYTQQITPKLKKNIESGKQNPIQETLYQEEKKPEVKQPMPQGVIRAATPQEQKALSRSKNPLYQIPMGFYEGFTLKDAPSDLRSDQPISARSVGYAAGLLGGIAAAGFSSEAATAAKVPEGYAIASSQVNKLLTVARGTKTGAFVTDIALTTGKVAAATKGTEIVLNNANPSINRNREVAKVAGADIGKARTAARVAEQEAIANQGSAFQIPIINKGFNLKSVANEINPLLAGDKQAYKSALEQEFRAQGLSEAEVQSAVRVALKERESGGIAEIGGLLYISKSSEALGRRYVTEKFGELGAKGVVIAESGTGLKLFKYVAPQIAKAGAVEGVSTAITQDMTRSQKSKPLQIAGYGVFGAASAGLIGGTIAATQLSKPTVSKTIEVASYISDPYEFAGDKAQDLTESVGKRLGKVYPEPKIHKNTPTPAATLSFGVTANTKSNTQAKANSDIATFAPTEVPVNTNVDINTKSNPQIYIKSVVGTKVPTEIFTPVSVPINTKIDTKTNINPLIDTPVDVPVSVAANIPVNINTATPFMRIPPILPLELPRMGGSGAGTTYSKKRYVNEIAASSAVLNDLMNSSFNNTEKLLKTNKKPQKTISYGGKLYKLTPVKNRKK